MDDQRVLLGSQNLTNAGSPFNRDAVLRVRDGEVTRYLTEIFLYDRDVLSVQSADELVSEIRLHPAGTPTPAGFLPVSSRVFFSGY